MEGARRAEGADLARLAELCRQAVEELAGERGGPTFLGREARGEPVEASLGAELSDPGRLVLAGTVDGVTVGYATARLEELHRGGRLAVLSDLFVEPDAREVGVGEALVDAVIAWAVENDCAGVDAWALPGARATKNFFEANGFKARLLTVHRRLSAPPSEPAPRAR